MARFGQHQASGDSDRCDYCGVRIVDAALDNRNECVAAQEHAWPVGVPVSALYEDDVAPDVSVLIAQARAEELERCIDVMYTHRITGYFCSCGEEINSWDGHWASVMRREAP